MRKKNLKLLNKKRVIAIIMAAALSAGMTTVALADNATDLANYTGYSAEQSISDNVVTATAHRAASPLPDMLGCNTNAGYGMINGGTITTLAAANESMAYQTWGSQYNQLRNPYYANSYYNFWEPVYNVVNSASLPDSNNALINGTGQGSPIKAEVYEDGTPSFSLSTTPDVVIGVDTSNSYTGSFAGYDVELSGMTGYSPKLSRYNPTTLDDMVHTVYEGAVNVESTGKKTRYAAVANYSYNATTAASFTATDANHAEADRNAQYAAYIYNRTDNNTIAASAVNDTPIGIAYDYETYVHGIQGYILKQINDEHISKKTVAIIKAITVTEDEDEGTIYEFTVAGQGATSTTSSDRYVEYTSQTCNNVTANATETVAASVINGADYIISESSAVDTALRALPSNLITVNSANIIYYDQQPDTLYGIFMNSVENAMGLAFYNGVIYQNQDSNLNMKNLLKYFYIKFMHIKSANLDSLFIEAFDDPDSPTGNNAISTNAGTHIDESVTYAESTIETNLLAGENYYHITSGYTY